LSHAPLQLAVIVGSNREGRFGGTVAAWFAAHATSRPDMALDVIDLADVELPMALPNRPGPALRGYLDRLDRADAFVVVTPEYNHGYPASLKQAIDLGHDEWRAKPAGFVSYGGIGGGLRAVEQLRPVFAALDVVCLCDVVSFHMAWEQFDGTGEPRDPERWARAATRLLDQLAWWGAALRSAREADRARYAAVDEPAA
jgi:NAD(P)H-dependent FMN reductase